MVICSFLPCGNPAVPELRPHLCERHRDLEICPTCQWWPWGRRASSPCVTCGGSTYCSSAGADRAIREWRREERWERRDVRPEVRDARWRVSPLWGVYGRDPEPELPDWPDFAPGSPVGAPMGEGGYPTPTPTAGTRPLRGSP